MLNKKVFNFDKNKINSDFDLMEYTHIRGYHGCCPIDLKNYCKNGIVPINKKFAQEQAIKLLCSDNISVDKVKRIFNLRWNELGDNHKYVWMALSKKELLNECGHYLIYGSEFICSIAAKLFCQSSLRGKGLPTIFHCDIPIESVANGYIDDMNKKIRNGDGSSCGFKIRGVVLPENIVKCEHPKKIPDPLNRYKEYFYEI
jgi:hypothetical protein